MSILGLKGLAKTVVHANNGQGRCGWSSFFIQIMNYTSFALLLTDKEVCFVWLVSESSVGIESLIIGAATYERSYR